MKIAISFLRPGMAFVKMIFNNTDCQSTKSISLFTADNEILSLQGFGRGRQWDPRKPNE